MPAVLNVEELECALQERVLVQVRRALLSNLVLEVLLEAARAKRVR